MPRRHDAAEAAMDIVRRAIRIEPGAVEAKPVVLERVVQ